MFGYCLYCDEAFLYVLIPAGEQRIIKTGEQSRQPNKHSVAHISWITTVGWLSKISAAQRWSKSSLWMVRNQYAKPPEAEKVSVRSSLEPSGRAGTGISSSFHPVQTCSAERNRISSCGAGGSMHTAIGSSLLPSPGEAVKTAGFARLRASWTGQWGKAAQMKLLHHKAQSSWLIAQKRHSPAEAYTERQPALPITSVRFHTLVHQNAIK